MNGENHEFDVALSFAGEDRDHAEALARILRDHDVRVFYDEFNKSTLWGKDLYQHLQHIYKDKAKYCVIFVSRSYLEKNWTKHELQQAQARSFQKDREYILPLRLDDSALPGVNPTIGYVDLKVTTVTQVAILLLEKLNLPTVDVEVDQERAKWSGDLVEYNGVMIASFWPKQIERAQHEPLYLVTAAYDRIRHGDEKMWGRKKPVNPCHDCAALPGQYHVPGCDMERCPACGGQSISCGCRHEAISRDGLGAWKEREEN
jgi:TIR domain